MCVKMNISHKMTVILHFRLYQFCWTYCICCFILQNDFRCHWIKPENVGRRTYTKRMENHIQANCDHISLQILYIKVTLQVTSNNNVLLFIRVLFYGILPVCVTDLSACNQHANTDCLGNWLFTDICYNHIYRIQFILTKWHSPPFGTHFVDVHDLSPRAFTVVIKYLSHMASYHVASHFISFIGLLYPIGSPGHINTLSPTLCPRHFQTSASCISTHDDVIKWKHFPRYWPFVRGIHRSPVNSPHKGQWRGALMFSLICARMKDWVNNREADDLRRHRDHYDVSVILYGHNEQHWRISISI